MRNPRASYAHVHFGKLEMIDKRNRKRRLTVNEDLLRYHKRVVRFLHSLLVDG